MKRKLISFDWAIKKLLRSKANFGILAGFLSELMYTDITIIEILESETNKEYSDNKQSRVDIKVRDSNNQLILIEIQYTRELDYFMRILFETSKCIVEHLKEGSPYSGIAKVISISILYFDFCHGDDYIYHGTTDFIGIHNHSRLKLSKSQQKLFDTDSLPDLFPEHYIINVNRFDDIATDTLDEWIYFLKNEEIKPDFKAKGLLEAQEKLDILKLDGEEKIAYAHYQKQQHRLASILESNQIFAEEAAEARGIVQGIEQQKQQHHQAQIESAKKMLASGLTLAQVVEFTQLPQTEVEALKGQDE